MSKLSKRDSQFRNRQCQAAEVRKKWAKVTYLIPFRNTTFADERNWSGSGQLGPLLVMPETQSQICDTSLLSVGFMRASKTQSRSWETSGYLMGSSSPKLSNCLDDRPLFPLFVQFLGFLGVVSPVVSQGHIARRLVRRRLFLPLLAAKLVRGALPGSAHATRSGNLYVLPS